MEIIAAHTKTKSALSVDNCYECYEIIIISYRLQRKVCD